MQRVRTRRPTTTRSTLLRLITSRHAPRIADLVGGVAGVAFMIWWLYS
jgi:hypothetical protein